MEFNVGDTVVLINGEEWASGEKYKTITGKRTSWVGEIEYKLNNKSTIWYDSELKLYEESQTEFIFQELFTLHDRFGKSYECTSSYYNIKSVCFSSDGEVSVEYKNKNSNRVMISNECKFKLEETKKKMQIIKVEHGKNREQYEFIGINETDYCTMINKGDFVECDTKQGRCYGRCVGRIVKELTETEIKEYKECWRAE